MVVPSVPWPDFSKRSHAPEIMDRSDVPPLALEAALTDIAKVNRFLGGSASLFAGLKKLTQAEIPFPKHILDLGCGGGDLTYEMAQWVNTYHPGTKVTGVDLLPTAIDFAKARHHAPGLDFAVGDAFHLQVKDPEQTLLTCSMFLHHLSDAEIGKFLEHAHTAGFGSVILNDLHRHFLAFWGFRLLAVLGRFSPVATHDGAVSVCRSFVRSDWQALVQGTGWHVASLQWHWAFRWTVVLKRNV